LKSRAVIITADDLGLWPEVNDAVMAGYDAGVITSAGLRVSEQASHSAMVSAGMRPGLGIGLHLVLCDGHATLPHRHIPNLVDSSNQFVSRPLEAAWIYRRGAGIRNELKAEIRAQIEKFLASGLFLTHVSGAYNLHLHPTVMSILKELAGDYTISAIRKPCGGIIRYSQRYSTPGWQRRFERSVLKPMSAWGRVRSTRFLGPDRVQPLSPTRPVTEHEVAARLRSARRGVTEFVCHPGSFYARYDGGAEAAVVTSSVVRLALAEGNVEPVSYRDIAEGTVGMATSENPGQQAEEGEEAENVRESDDQHRGGDRRIDA
jgi:predicted glycoside hydrolase/deacetylase ChbG (UPF0249 family)